MRTLLSFIAILLLATSSLPIGFADITPVDLSNIESTDQQITQTTQSISINLDETLGLSSDSPRKKQIESVSIFITDHTTKSIHLDEKLSVHSSTSDKQIHYDYVVAQSQPSSERILHTDKLRDDRKKNTKIESLYLDNLYQQQSTDLISIDSNVIQTTFFADPFNLISDYISGQNIIESINNLKENSLIIYSVSNFDLSFLLDDSFVIVIFTPLVFLLLIFLEDVKFKFEKIRPFLSLIFIVIILSTVVVTPYSISSTYWPEAYADTGNMDEQIQNNITASTDNTSSSSTPAEDTESTEVSSSTQPTASTDNTSSSSTPAEDTETVEDSTSNPDASVGSTSSSSTPAEDTESTEVSSSTNSTTTVPTNSTTTVPTNSTTTVPTNSTTTVPTNSTTTVPTNSTTTVPT
ncbi:MAG: hypothetical protein ACW9XH_02680, partial [Candidatus Nitrosopumilus sp. bin_32a]